jgi:hypothetical protein
MAASSDATVTAALVSGVVGVTASLVAGWLARPKTKADASKASVEAKTTDSAEYRAWAQVFIDQTQRAEQKAAAAEARAAAAEDRCDGLEARIRSLETFIVQQGLQLPPH